MEAALVEEEREAAPVPVRTCFSTRCACGFRGTKQKHASFNTETTHSLDKSSNTFAPLASRRKKEKLRARFQSNECLLATNVTQGVSASVTQLYQIRVCTRIAFRHLGWLLKIGIIKRYPYGGNQKVKTKHKLKCVVFVSEVAVYSFQHLQRGASSCKRKRFSKNSKVVKCLPAYGGNKHL